VHFSTTVRLQLVNQSLFTLPQQPAFFYVLMKTRPVYWTKALDNVTKIAEVSLKMRNLMSVLSIM